MNWVALGLSQVLRDFRLAWIARALLGTPLSICPTTCALVWWGDFAPLLLL